MILPVYRIHTTYCLHHIKEGLEDRITDRFLCCTCWHLLMSFLVFFTSGLRLLVTKCSSCGFCSKCSTDRLLDSKKREASRIARALTLTLYTIVQSRGLLTTMQFPSLCVRCATAGFRAFFFLPKHTKSSREHQAKNCRKKTLSKNPPRTDGTGIQFSTLYTSKRTCDLVAYNKTKRKHFHPLFVCLFVLKPKSVCNPSQNKKNPKPSIR